MLRSTYNPSNEKCGALFGIGARCKFHKPDEENDELMGVNPATDGTQINTITHLSTAKQYRDTMSSFQKFGVDGLAFLYNRHLKELTVKVRYDSHLVEDASTDKFLPENNISNLRIRILDHHFFVDGVPREVIHYDRGANGVCIINEDQTNTEEISVVVLMETIECSIRSSLSGQA
jgi:hypothetical protein